MKGRGEFSRWGENRRCCWGGTYTSIARAARPGNGRGHPGLPTRAPKMGLHNRPRPLGAGARGVWGPQRDATKKARFASGAGAVGAGREGAFRLAS